MKILSPEEIKKPVGGLFRSPERIAIHPTEEIMGAAGDLGAYYTSLTQKDFGETATILFSDNDTTKFQEDISLQRNNSFDPYDCVTCAHLGLIYCLHQALFNAMLAVKSRRFTAVDSGTIPNRGNSNYKVQQSIMNTGLVNEADYPTMSPVMTQAEFFKAIPPEVRTKENFKQFFEVKFYAVPTRDGVSATRQNLFNTLLYSPMVVSVDGNYDFDAQGRVIRSSQNDTHDVLLMKMSKDGTTFDLVLDSENPNGFVKFAPDYDYHYPTWGYLKKKIMFQLIKEIGLPAVYLYSTASDSYFPIYDGDEVKGGDLLKAFCGNYGNAGIKGVPAGAIPKDKIKGGIKQFN